YLHVDTVSGDTHKLDGVSFSRTRFERGARVADCSDLDASVNSQQHVRQHLHALLSCTGRLATGRLDQRRRVQKNGRLGSPPGLEESEPPPIAFPLKLFPGTAGVPPAHVP